jgi:hypothetical protein
MTVLESKLCYPRVWEAEYETKGLVEKWLVDYREMFQPYVEGRSHRGTLAANVGQLDLFAQYALMYLLRERDGVESLTWYKLGLKKPGNRELRAWQQMRTLMGAADFERLRSAIHDAGLKNFVGEPDLFCWRPDGTWFFAEAKRKDKTTPRFEKWIGVATVALGDLIHVEVCRLCPRTWIEQLVPDGTELFQLSYGPAGDDILAARVGWSKNHAQVEFVIEDDMRERRAARRAVSDELDFYLVTKGERDPLGYAIHHCSTAANVYSKVHWAHTGRSPT